MYAMPPTRKTDVNLKTCGAIFQDLDDPEAHIFVVFSGYAFKIDARLFLNRCLKWNTQAIPVKDIQDSVRKAEESEPE